MVKVRTKATERCVTLFNANRKGTRMTTNNFHTSDGFKGTFLFKLNNSCISSEFFGKNLSLEIKKKDYS